jgi:glycine/D-amino acid oxidase-like deaminating enzyme
MTRDEDEIKRKEEAQLKAHVQRRREEDQAKMDIELHERLVADLRRLVDRTFYTGVLAYRAQGLVEPQTYHKALDDLNKAVQPFNDVYRA